MATRYWGTIFQRRRVLRLCSLGSRDCVNHFLFRANVVLFQTRLAVVSWAAFRSSKNFKDPELFLPERWMLDEPGFEKYHSFDKREVVQPFSYGPRNCLGKK